jgi:DNA polymerase III subunit epsilon
LRGLSRGNALCPRLVGLESGTGACSAHASGKCRGVCVGHESRVAHRLRLIQALYRMRIPEWPHAGPVAILERDFARTRAELHVILDWRYLGSAREPSEVQALLDAALPLPAFDIDIFKLLQRCLQDTKRYRVIDPAQLPNATPQEWYE